MSYKTYDNYIHSESKWFDKIPQKWGIRPIKHLAKTIPGGTPSTSNLEYWENGDIPWLPSGMVQNCIINKEDAFKFITEKGLQNSATKNIGPNSVLIALTGGTCANIGYLTFKATANQSVISIEPYKFFAKYIYYALLSQREQILDKKTGGAQSGINEDDVKNILIPTMSPEEQKQIANYLDIKTINIDEIIAKNKKLIEILEEKRISLINEVVTKGLNPNVKMKNSEMKWVEEMPEHWDIERGKHILTQLKRNVKYNDEVITCFRDGEVTLRRKRRETGFTMSDKEIGYQGIEVNDLVVHGMDGFAGAIGISDSRGKGSPVLIVLDSKQNKKYLMYYLRNLAYNNVFLALSTGIRVRSCDLRWEKLANLTFLIPPLNEQKEISDYLDSEILKIYNIIAKIKKHTALLEEYKYSLIHHVVTGKIDVRGGQVE